MKKSILLGVAALAAAVAVSGNAGAGETKIGGYYMFRGVQSDESTVRSPDDRSMYHRLQLNMDFYADDTAPRDKRKTHAHLVTRAFDGQIYGADAPILGADTGDKTFRNKWQIRQGWLETQAFDVGVKVGNMPISLNDDILVNQDTTSFGTLMLTKSFNGIDVIAADVKISERNGNDPKATSNASTALVDKGDEDLYVLVVSGKAPLQGGARLAYQVTGAYLQLDKNSDVSTLLSPGDTLNDWWFATTLSYLRGEKANDPKALPDLKLVGTMIYENGVSGFNKTPAMLTPGWQLHKSGWLAAARADGKVAFGRANGYAFYATRNFTNVSNKNPVWSDTWDQSGPGASDLLNTFARTTMDGKYNASATENMWGMGAGVTVVSGAWNIRPMVDYTQIVAGGGHALYDHAYGGSLMLSTNIDVNTMLLLGASYVMPRNGDNNKPTAADNATDTHFFQAAIRMNF